MSSFSFWVGNYARPDEAGLQLWRFSEESGFTVQGAYCGLRNPSFVLQHPSLPALYAVEEGPEGQITSWDLSGPVPVMSARLSTGGADPCHLGISADGRWIYTANYTGGSVACYPLDEKGGLLPRTDLVQHRGHSVNHDRQEGPHAHCVFPAEGNDLYVCDLGLDQVIHYRNQDGRLEEIGVIAFPAGAGPRHLAFHPLYPSLLFCLSELSAELFVINRDREFIQSRLSLLPESCLAGNTAAALHFTADGRWLIASQRGQDVLSVIHLAPDGTPSLYATVPTLPVPRDFLIRGNTLIVGSQQDGRVQACRLADGEITPTDRFLRAPAPVCFQPAFHSPV